MDKFCQFKIKEGKKPVLCYQELTDNAIKWCEERKTTFGNNLFCYAHQEKWLENVKK